MAILDANFSSLAPATPPSVSVTSPVTVPANQTTIAVMYQVTGVVGWTYPINFFASVSGGQPYLLGSDAQTLTGSPQSFTKTFSFAPSNASQTVTLTAAIVPDVTFDIPTGTAPFVISPAAALPTVTVPMTIDGTTEAGVVIDGAGQSFDGLTLGAGSDGSTIAGLAILNFNSGVVVLSNNNTIGGTVNTAVNTIASNTLAGVLIGTGTQSNAVEGNDIGGISAAITGVTSVPNLTTVDFTMTGIVGQAYTIAFYASPPTGSTQPQFLGTFTTPSLTSRTQQGLTATFDLATPLQSGQTVTGVVGDPATIGTVTSPPGQVAIPFTITGTVGCAYTVTFYASPPKGSTQPQFLGTYTTPPLTTSTQSFTATFNLATPLQNGQIPTGFASELASNGYAVQIVNSNDNTIGVDTSGHGAGNTIGFSASEGVGVLSGFGNQVQQNTYIGTNGPSSLVPANDIAVAPGANGNAPRAADPGSRPLPECDGARGDVGIPICTDPQDDQLRLVRYLYRHRHDRPVRPNLSRDDLETDGLHRDEPAIHHRFHRSGLVRELPVRDLHAAPRVRDVLRAESWS